MRPEAIATITEILPQPTDAQNRAAAEARVEAALHHIEQAQNHLNSACQMLCALTYGHPTWKAVGAVSDRVRTMWYRVREFGHSKRYRLDPTNVEALARELAKVRR